MAAYFTVESIFLAYILAAWVDRAALRTHYIRIIAPRPLLISDHRLVDLKRR